MRRVGCGTLEELWTYAREDIARFYHELVAQLDLAWFAPYAQTLDLSRGLPFARWFAGGRYNASFNCLDRWVHAGRGAESALVWEGEDGAVRTFTFDELLEAVCRLAGALRALGVERGDRVGIFMPLLPETAIALLAIGRIGAIAVPAFSGYGAPALAARLADAQAKVLLTVDGVWRRAKPVDMKAVADAALADVPSVKHVLVFARTGAQVNRAAGRDIDWNEAVSAAPEFVEAEQTASDEPYLLLYTSGSTGKPKGAVHGHAGFPIKVQIDQYLCFDVKPGERMLWFTDMGWMMGPFLVLGALGLGASIMLYEGTPDYPKPDRLWDVVARHRVTHLGIAPTAIRSLMAHGDEWPAKHDLSSLRILASSGEAWNPEPYRWFSKMIGGDRAPIINYSGGTEISGGILGCYPVRDLVPCAFHGPVFGMDADVVDASGNSVRGEVGELVVRQPWPGMTQGFWHDDERYLKTYWSRFPDVWVHGDWASVDAAGFWFIHGRSDDTINVAGKRVGPAEYESAIVAHGGVREVAAVSVPDELKGESVVCLVVLRDGIAESEALRTELTGKVTANLGKALAPKAVKFVDDLPHTRNGKMMRRVARARYLRSDSLGDLSALENPASLDAIDRAR
ncbi:MAG: AMP-binding protein [Candidatus Eremiobacteraeota bacterium]|nr:AMP-binding protein [Candidatus Eremiobacteraeota bacterium]MBV8364898.1 AMP-binding protein [Candidatus Eremiobacteraeota bacterium]